ncbi:hypothetical protein QBC47DRAFT_409788 [Echria macrotheca]|uniref:Zn(2)-C6 fungal-type domain-containing protein n=1 Tax=Echria macrotheca TaxID=438768 RepID=A0AAJ0BKQ3_9PEZI|nr:hypothetical protein QBC47DRAFT_409788 [Echria macrotheca]
MLKRKSHTKSKNGCRSCKKRHVKCDEQGPPCLNCVMRKETDTCSYGFLRQANAATSSVVPVPSQPPTSSPRSFSSSASVEVDRLLELELIHRWSIRSWTCQASTPHCQPYLLQYLPRAALRHGYLLNAILATAAVDLGISCASTSPTDSARYFKTALAYGTKATADFRTQVTSLAPDNVDLVFYFTSLVAVLQFTVMCDTSISLIDRVCEYATMGLKSGRMIFDNMQWMMASSSPLGTIIRNFAVDLSFLDQLDPQTKAALELMSSVSQQVRVPPTSPTIQGSAVLTGEMVICEDGAGPLASDVYIYKLAIGQTKYCYAEELQNRLKGYFHNVFAVSGSHFVAAVRGREPMAIFILMYWAVLVQRAAKDPALWALVSEGRDLVAESSTLLLFSDIIDVPGVREGIAWTRNEVDLFPLPGCPLPAMLTRSGITEGFDTDALEALSLGVEI